MKYCALCKVKYDDAVSFCPVDGEVLEDDPSSIVGTVLDGQYHIEALLGKGGMGAVFRARHILLGDRVAIKVLPPEMRTNAEWLRRFRREGQAARRFRHPNAVTVYDLRTASDGMIYMVMEYVEGHTLDAELKARGHFTPAEAVAALEPIMSVLNAAHQMGVVHRDLKPENIMIGKSTNGGEPNVKLLDLGIAKLREVAGGDTGKSTALTVAGQMLGTPYYMSPEQWGELPRDGNSEIDGRADIYSLGLVFYEMIAGRRPYSAMTLLELRKEHVSVMPRPLDEVMPGVPRRFSDVIARAVAKDRSDRPDTAGQLAAELKASLAASVNGATKFVSVLEDEGRRSSPLETLAEGARATNSDVDAPTIVTVDAGGSASGSPAGEAHSNQSPAATIPTLVESADGKSRDTAQQGQSHDASQTLDVQRIVPPVMVPQTGPATPVLSQGSRSKVPLIIAGVIVVVLLSAGIGGFLILSSLRGSNSPDPGNTGSNNRNTGLAPKTRELARYWLEVSSPTANAKSSQVVPVIPVASGQLFKFHFVPTAAGYLYIVGPGATNKLTTFLTGNTDFEATGWATNELKQGVDASFPTGQLAGEERWLQLDKKPGTEAYILIFSPTRLEIPAFFNEAKPNHELTASEQQELKDLIDKYKSANTNDYNNSDSSAPFVAVKSSNPNTQGNPLVIDIRIEHK